MRRSRIRRPALLALAATTLACQSAVRTREPRLDASHPAPAPVDAGASTTRTADMPRLPEDPEAGRRSQAQWRQHLDHEEQERQLAFDGRRLPEHRTLVKLLRAARARVDGARSRAAVERLAGPTAAAVTKARARLHELDHWGVNSRLLPDYDELLDILDGAYAAARVAALTGRPEAQEQLRARWDRHMRTIDDWLTEAANADREP